ncbi:MAG: hypothetical protein MPK34_09310, partial [Gammaproteobacteria bacterium]|nr:hypothetical protein [Gammaproteobacteria bacterium]MDA7962562.1 hypothetical protein [Gammaproteobacteria bacterium]MDA8024647.1 hypothetical protein [Gammaproteobacteria bacterium]
MQNTFKTLLKPAAVALLLLFAAAPLVAPPSAHAQSAGTGGFWFAAPGETPTQSAALATFDVLTSPAESDGSRTFQVDVMYGDNIVEAQQVSFEVHMDSSKLELVGVENVAEVLGLNPVADSFMQTSYADYASTVGEVPDDGDATTDSLIYPTWSALGVGSGVFDLGTLSAPERTVTLNFKWKAGAAGNAKLNFTANAAALTAINSYVTTPLDIQGPPLAGIDITPRTMQEIEPFKVT